MNADGTGTSRPRPRMDQSKLLPGLRERKFLWLLAALLVLAVVVPLVQGRYFAFNVLFCVVLLASAFSVSQRRRQLTTVVLLGIPALVGTSCAYLAAAWTPIPDVLLMVFVHSTDFVFLGVVSGLILYDVLQGKRVTGDKICGAICVYLLIAVAWSHVYSLIEQIEPGSFAATRISELAADPGGGQFAPRLLFSYYSFVTLTTLGYGDVTPVSAAARTFSWLEAVVGQLYLVVLIARLVGLHVSQSDDP
jgi:hypothetical protein